MPDISYEFLAKFFRDHLPFTPTPVQVDLFQRDLGLVSPFLMEAALREVKAGIVGSILVYTPNEWRPAIFRVYNRKVAEHAQMFPIFHAFETAFRSTVAVKLEQHYDCRCWWQCVYDQKSAGKPLREIKVVRQGGRPINRLAVDAVSQIISAVDGEDFRRDAIRKCKNGYEFVENCDLAHIGKLIEVHWTGVFRDAFMRGNARLPLTDFCGKFKRVREARNDVYHHKSVARMKDVAGTAEDLLDYLDFSLGFVHEKITSATPTAPTFAMPREPRHRIW